jgi:hypothetical protein
LGTSIGGGAKACHSSESGGGSLSVLGADLEAWLGVVEVVGEAVVGDSIVRFGIDAVSFLPESRSAFAMGLRMKEEFSLEF